MPNDNYEFYLYTKKRHKPFLVTQTHEIQTEQRNKTENEQLKLGSQGLLGSVSVSGFSSIFCLSVCLSGWRSIYLSIYLNLPQVPKRVRFWLYCPHRRLSKKFK